MHLQAVPREGGGTLGLNNSYCDCTTVALFVWQSSNQQLFSIIPVLIN